MSRKYKPVTEGEWIQPRRRGYRLECCDYGLVHRLNFRLVKSLNGGSVIQFQPFRDKRATAQVRRYNHKSTK